MRRVSVRSMRVLCLAALVFCVVGMAWAEVGREFAASYKFANVSESNDVINLTITLNLRNNSGASISDGNVVLFSSEANPALLGSFPLIKMLQNSQLVTMSQTFSIPKSEYQLWGHGRDPSFRFVVEDSNGALRTEEIDLHRMGPGVAATK